MKKSISLRLSPLIVLFLPAISLNAQTTANALDGSGHIAITSDAFSITSLAANSSSFYWIPSSNSLRFGLFDSTSAAYTIGQYSLAGPKNAKAGGLGSIALGLNPTADGVYSIAIGQAATAEAPSSIALGQGSRVESTAAGGVAIAGGYVNAPSGGVAIGNGATFGGGGSQSVTSGQAGFSAVGGDASGLSATSIGVLTIAAGYYSTALGGATAVDSKGGTAVGMGNLDLKKDGVTVPDNLYPDSADPIFEVGNGDIGEDPDTGAFVTKSNALTIYRDGTIRMSKASGGISMGVFQ